jgi:purine-binding chemotaxis protein CheW
VAQVKQNFLSFQVGEQWYGINIDDIIEVTYLVRLTELPAATPDMLGLITVRDEVMPVIDLRLRFGLGEAPLRMDTPILCVHSKRGAIGLVVDEAEDVLAINESNISDYDGSDSRYLKGVLRLPDRLLLLLDAARLRAEVHESDLQTEAEETADESILQA